MTAGAPPELDGLQVLGRLGAGGYAEVWRARDATGRDVALKIAHAGHGAARERLEREARALEDIGAPAAPALLGSAETRDGRLALVLELVDGRPLDAAHGLPLGELLARSAAAAAAVAAVHARGFVHADLKPDNFVFAAAGARLLDFGSAFLAGTRARPEGTPEYAAPESLGDAPALDERVDVYALGVLLHELATGARPFAGAAAALAVAHRALRPPRLDGAGEPGRAFAALVTACLEKDPARRPRDAAAVAAALASLAAGAHANERLAAQRRAGAGGEPPQPVALLWVPGPQKLGELSTLVRAGGGRLAQRLGGGATIWAFTTDERAEPVHAAAAMARALARGAVVHVAEATLRRSELGNVVVESEALADPPPWLPATRGDAPGTVVFTDEAQQALGPGRGAGAPARGPFVGRDDLVRVARASLERAGARGASTLLVVTGDAGLGKSRAAQELAALARARGHHVEAVDGAALDRAALARAVEATAPVFLVIDDLHRADAAAVDLVEQLTLGGRAAPAWVVVTASPGMPRLAAGLGRRAERLERVDLAALGDAATAVLVRDLLAPAEYVASDAIARIAAWSGGNPRFVHALAERLHQSGAIRRRPSGAAYLATAALDALALGAPERWLAERELAALPPEVTAVARRASVLAAGTPVELLGEILGDGLEVDAGFAAGALAAAGIFDRRRPGEVRFVSESLRAALEATLPAAERVALHVAALAALDRGAADSDDALAARARHALAAGRADVAATARLVLASRLAARHDWVGVDVELSAALPLLAPADPRRTEALVLRGRARCRLYRLAESIEDLEAAIAAAAAPRLAALARLHLATTLDWAEEHARGAAVVEEAATDAVAADEDAALAARVGLGRGRAAWRRGELADAVTLLGAAADAARALPGEEETLAVARLLLGSALVWTDQLDRGEAVFAEAIAGCRASGDQLHHCTSIANHTLVSYKRRDLGAAATQLRETLRIARRIGHPGLEQIATFNLAEILYWSRRFEEALRMARRGRELQRRFAPRQTLDETVLLLRIEAARGDQDAAGAHRAMLRATPLGDEAVPVRLFAGAVVAFLDAGERGYDPAWWRAAREEGAVALAGGEMLELLWWQATTARVAGHHDGVQQALMAAAPELVHWEVWRSPFEALAAV